MLSFCNPFDRPVSETTLARSRVCKLVGLGQKGKCHDIQRICSAVFLKIKIYETVISPVVLYGCETWSLTLREEHTLRVFENSVEDIWT
jgi:hypothetical protein